MRGEERRHVMEKWMFRMFKMFRMFRMFRMDGFDMHVSHVLVHGGCTHAHWFGSVRRVHGNTHFNDI